ncbi:Fe-S cluster assembly ATPase SufC [Spiroplasma endosymbiont of Panorpa germanica]|uniref:Fe-S cluster assembly ATPase SufC n=1 Tax=Spiroplasma endosymbiont of Panorpa germanica TaxID=3066314 RepID=UPI0030D5F40F
MSHKLEIKNLHVEIEGKEILKGINLVVKTGETHALMGPNGNGKSTLLMAIMGHPKYKITKGDILFDSHSIIEDPVDERSRMGIFLALQSPQTIPGVSNLEFLKYIVNSHSEEKQKLPKIFADIKTAAGELNFDVNMLKRSVNDGFSGGEKKKNEILQMKLLHPKFALIDEIDSGLDVDALEIVSQNLNKENVKDLGMIIVSHYDRFFNKVAPTHAHVIIDGKIVVSGDAKIVERINKEGYSWAKSDKKN